MVKYNTEQFISKARKIHGDLYNYDKSNYKGRNKKIVIICHKHGEFEQRAGHHLKGQGCKICGFKKMAEKIETWTEEMDNFLIQNYVSEGANFCKDVLKKSLYSIYNRTKILGIRKNNNKLNSPYISGRMWSNLLSNSKNRNLSLEITHEDIYQQYINQNKKCALTGKELLLSPDFIKNEASVDRIDSKKGYTKDNIQLVHKKINQIKMDLPEDELFSMCKNIYFNLKEQYERRSTI